MHDNLVGHQCMQICCSREVVSCAQTGARTASHAITAARPCDSVLVLSKLPIKIALHLLELGNPLRDLVPLGAQKAHNLLVIELCFVPQAK